MKNKIVWIILGLLLLLVFGMTFMRTPQQIGGMLAEIAGEMKNFSAFVHLLFIAVLIVGLIFEKVRRPLFSFFMAFVCLSATLVAIVYGLLPNIIIFAIFFVLILNAYFRKKLDFNFGHIKSINIFFGIAAMLFGFWYLHWVEAPVWLNALLYSPLGAVNCPTMLVVTGFLCLNNKPRSVMLEATVALTTLYFGFFGVFLLGAYVDVVMIICALFLIVRLGSFLSYEGYFERIPVDLKE
jgi:hypothetical protein